MSALFAQYSTKQSVRRVRVPERGKLECKHHESFEDRSRSARDLANSHAADEREPMLYDLYFRDVERFRIARESAFKYDPG
jgi:hypothetical protein